MSDEATTITFENLKVEDKEFNDNSIVELADRPNASSSSGEDKLSAKQLKERFDANPNLIRKRFNELLAKIENGEVAENLKAKVVEKDKEGKEVTTEVSLYKLLQYILDGELSKSYLKARKNATSDPDVLDNLLSAIDAAISKIDGKLTSSGFELNKEKEGKKFSTSVAAGEVGVYGSSTGTLYGADSITAKNENGDIEDYNLPLHGDGDNTLATEGWVKKQVKTPLSEDIANLDEKKLDANGAEWVKAFLSATEWYWQKLAIPTSIEAEGSITAYTGHLGVKSYWDLIRVYHSMIIYSDLRDGGTERFLYFPWRSAPVGSEEYLNTIATIGTVEEYVKKFKIASVNDTVVDGVRKLQITFDNGETITMDFDEIFTGIDNLLKDKANTSYVDLSISSVKNYLDNKKLDKITEADKIYGTNADSDQIKLTYGTGNVGSLIVQRMPNGEIVCGTPYNTYAATPKSYVDKVSKRVDNLEGMLIKYTEYDSVAYEKRVPEASAHKAILSRIGGACVIKENLWKEELDADGVYNYYDPMQEYTSQEYPAGTYTVKIDVIDGRMSMNIKGKELESGEIYTFTAENPFCFYFTINSTDDDAGNTMMYFQCKFKPIIVSGEGLYASAPVTAIVSEGKSLFDNDTSQIKMLFLRSQTTGQVLKRYGYEVHLPVGNYTVTLEDLKPSEAKYWYGVIVDKDGYNVSKLNLLQDQENPTPLTFTIKEGEKIFWYDGAFTDINTTMKRMTDCRVSVVREGNGALKTYTIPPELISKFPDYGQGNPDNPMMCNYLDFDDEAYYHTGGIENGEWKKLDTVEVIDVSGDLYFVGLKGINNYFFIDVEGGGTVRFENENKLDVPSIITFAEV